MAQVAHGALAEPERPARTLDQAQQLPTGQISRQTCMREVPRHVRTADFPCTLFFVAVDPVAALAV